MHNFLRFFSCFTTFFFLLFPQLSQAESALQRLPLPDKIKEKIKKHDIHVESKVETFEGDGQSIKGEGQRLKFQIIGLHKKSCARALAILSQYENFKNHIDFVKDSRYTEATQEIYLLLSSSLLPFDMSLSFKIPRITGPGDYAFSFQKGFLKDLVGTIHIADEKEFCLFYTEASWSGPYSNIPSPIFELFSTTLSRLSMEKLFKISGSF
ncbi:MAG: hypothetical protein A2X86_15910 [Bdellovibrionales bacterium GWA2_49_15]|nr:MAG: hypothetical protein A2X86_15910 [Bdellovibrionales bacterium GWA2_49_15]HAZ12423.1 hypothetical protein [Bdellovibrionales bacterium]